MQHILFDLDGTLTDPAEGITGSVAHALAAMGHPVPPRKELERFIGPPLDEAFGDFYGFTTAQVDEAVVLFREYFSDRGILENELYPGIPQLLESLIARGKTLHVATSKPTAFAQQVLARFDLARYFTIVEGSPLTHNGLPKAEVIRAVLAAGKIEPEDAVMVGDRRHDIAGAKQTGLAASVGVLYGYGSRQEFAAAGADHVAESVEHLGEVLGRVCP